MAPAKERTWMDESKLCRSVNRKDRLPRGGCTVKKTWCKEIGKRTNRRRKENWIWVMPWDMAAFYIFVTIIFPMMDSTGQWSRMILLYPSSRSDKYYVILSILMLSSLYHIISHRCHKVISHSHRNTSSVQCQLYWKEHSILKSLEAN